MSDRSCQSPDVSTPQPASEPTLRRETMVLAPDSGRLGLLVALCSMAGVAVGFGLSNIAIGLGGHQCAVHTHRAAPAQAPVLAAGETPPWLGVCVGKAPGGAVGARVAAVQPDTPADVAGIEVGDVIVGFTAGSPARRAHRIDRPARLIELVQASEAGQHAAVVFHRDGEIQTARVHLASMPRSVYEAGPYCRPRR